MTVWQRAAMMKISSMIERMTAVLALAICCLLAGLAAVPVAQAVAVRNQENGFSPTLDAKGVDPQQLTFAIGGAEINAFNFNFSVSFSEQLGFGAPVDGGLSLALSRVYTSNVYREKTWRCQNTCPYPPSDAAEGSRSWKYLAIRRQNPLGLGWDFHLGHIYQRDPLPWNGSTCGWDATTTPGPWVYAAPDGAEHVLLIDAGDSAAASPDTVFYSKDGSMLKAVQHASDGSWSLYLPGGEVAELGHFVDGTAFPDGSGATHCTTQDGGYFTEQMLLDPNATTPYRDREWIGWYTTVLHGREQIGGQPAARVVIEYQNPPFDHIIRKVYDSHHGENGADRAIELEIQRADLGQVVDALITLVKVPAPPDENGAPRPKTEFTFSYDTKTLLIDGIAHAVHVLSEVRSSATGYGFRYGYCDTPQGAAVQEGLPADFGGQLKSMRYPSGRLVTLEYGLFDRVWKTWRVEGDGPSCQSCPSERRQGLIGLKKKEEFLDGDSTHTGSGNRRTWTFTIATPAVGSEAHDDSGAGKGCSSACGRYATFYDSVSTMTEAPSGTVTQIQFETSTHTEGKDEPADSAIFGHAVQDTTKACLTGGTSCSTVKTTTRTWATRYTNTRLQVMWASQESEVEEASDDTSPEKPTLIKRYLDWNGDAGEYETVEVSGSGAGLTMREHTDYVVKNQSGGTDCTVDSTLHANWLPRIVGAKWTEVKNAQGAFERKDVTEYAFDTSTGRRTASVARLDPTQPLASPCHQSLTDLSPRSGDVVSETTYTAAGNVAEEKVHFANDTTQFRTQHDWSYGIEIGTRNPDLPSPGYYATTRTVDPATSLVLRECQFTTSLACADTDEHRRTWFDALRRPVKEQYGSFEPTRYDYVDESFGTGDDRNRMTSVRTYRGSESDLSETTDFYDFKGRVYMKSKLNPDGTRAYQHTLFDENGRVKFVSVWTTANAIADPNNPGTGTTTSYLDTAGRVDPLGRPHRITGPLGEVTDTTYFGTNKTVTVRGVSSGNATETLFDAATTYYTDGLGRLRAVASARRNAGVAEGADAVYTYDEANHLTKVNLVDTLALTPTSTDRYATSNADGQVRTFTFDPLGRQTSATNPENGTVQTLSWNAKGQPLTVQDAVGAVRHHVQRTTYDVAGRPTLVERALQDGQTAVQSRYHPGDAGWDLQNWSTNGSVACLGQTAWYIGESNCRYAQAVPLTATLTSPAIPAPQSGAVLVLNYFRETRDNGPTGNDDDRLRVLVRSASATDWAEAEELWAVDARQVSWSRVLRTPAFLIPDSFAASAIQIRVIFESVTTNTNTAVRGVGITEIAVLRPATVALASFAYDQGFGVTGNRYRGKLASVAGWDEGGPQPGDAGAAPSNVREFHYAQSDGLLSDEVIRVDWDRDGSLDAFETAYRYDTYGRSVGQRLPHPAGTPSHEYQPAYRHGALVGLTVDEEVNLLSDSAAAPGVEYDLSGGISRLHYGNGQTWRVDANAAFLPERISVVRANGTTAFDTGSYTYDGARNIKGIGPDVFRYDAVGRLDWARIDGAGGSYGTVDLDTQYDRYGNMTAQLTTGGPTGLNFNGRTYSGNRNNDSGFYFDANGNMLKDPVNNASYAFSPEDQLVLVRPPGTGRLLQESQYDPGGDRWVRIVPGDGGKALITLRDGSGQVAVDFEVRPGGSGPQLVKEYARAAGHLVAIQSACGPRPLLRTATPSKSGTLVMFERTDYIAASSAFYISIDSESGQHKTLTRSASLATIFGIDESEFFAGETNYVSIETRAACGATGYSNAVSYRRESNSSVCLHDILLYMTAFDSGGNADLGIGTPSGSSGCASGTTFNLYFQPASGGATVKLTQLALSQARLVIPHTPAGAGRGQYWWVPVSPITHQEGTPGPTILCSDQNAAQVQSASVAPAVNAQYVGEDHLGSVRYLADERGNDLGAWKFYPFGMEVMSSTAGDQRMKFTGHERDAAIGLDYMRARYCSAPLGRFVSVDALPASAKRSAPQTWNRYSYVGNNPVVLIDPTGNEADPAKSKTAAPFAGTESSPDNSSGKAEAGLLDKKLGTDSLGVAVKAGAASAEFHNGLDHGGSAEATVLSIAATGRVGPASGTTEIKALSAKAEGGGGFSLDSKKGIGGGVHAGLDATALQVSGTGKFTFALAGKTLSITVKGTFGAGAAASGGVNAVVARTGFDAGAGVKFGLGLTGGISGSISWR